MDLAKPHTGIMEHVAYGALHQDLRKVSPKRACQASGRSPSTCKPSPESVRQRSPISPQRFPGSLERARARHPVPHRSPRQEIPHRDPNLSQGPERGWQASGLRVPSICSEGRTPKPKQNTLTPARISFRPSAAGSRGDLTAGSAVPGGGRRREASASRGLAKLHCQRPERRLADGRRPKFPNRQPLKPSVMQPPQLEISTRGTRTDWP